MKTSIAACALTAFLAVPAFAQEDTTLVAPYRECLMTKARQLELSDADVADVIAASITACREVRRDIETQVIIRVAERAVDQGRQASPQLVEGTMVQIDRLLSDEVRLAVIEQRAAKGQR